MENDKQTVLAVLRAELEFVEKGGYRPTVRAAWRPHFIFQDSPTCLNFDPLRPRKPCRDCALADYIPEGVRSRKEPCRFIPLSQLGETIDSLYRTGTQDELEFAVANWLKAKITELERQEAAKSAGEIEIHVRAKVVS